MATIEGVTFHSTYMAPDHRGRLITLFKQSESIIPPPVQWNLVDSSANVLRGMHAHRGYDEYYLAIRGDMFFVLKDARARSPTFGNELAITSDELGIRGLLVPKGVAHGVYFKTDAIILYGLSNEWDSIGEFACRWDDGNIGIEWPTDNPILSCKDQEAGSFKEMVDQLSTK